MNYIIFIISISEDKFTYRLESELEKSDFIVQTSSKFFQTKEITIVNAKNHLKKLGVKDENIILYS